VRLKRSPLSTLRLSFCGLGAALLVAVAVLLSSALARLEDQRRLRQQMVAERVFDEAEREISSLLQHEAERDGSAYDAEDTDPERWSPFVVGYYRRDPELHLIAEDRIGAARSMRVRTAIEGVRSALDAPANAPIAQGAQAANQRTRDLAAQPSSPDVLRQLNRSVKVRARRQHDFSRTFVVAAAARDTLVVERQGAGGVRREGFVLDLPTLVSTIQTWVLGSQGLSDVARLYTAYSYPKTTIGTDKFAHRLATPLDSQTIYLMLRKLDDEDASATLYGLAALLGVAAIGGLFALYRMVAVQVRFAERRNNFVAAVTHELKTPLTSIRMYGEMLRDGMVSDETTRHEYYATITAEGERLTRLINNVMEHGKLRQGQRLPEFVQCQAADVVREVAELMTPHIHHEGFAIELHVEAGLPAVEIDADAFKQVLFNVIDNALKYGRGAAPRAIELRCGQEHGRVVVRVRDHGPGVAADQLESIFEPFFRGGDELTRRQKGTGIGLSLVRDLVELMHGEVQAVNREPGFEVRIALAGATGSAPRRAHAASQFGPL
jgi:signal transduction histidine kinase